MTVWLILSGIIAPAMFWIGYFYYKDRFKPEPLLRIGSTYLLGFAAAFLCLNVYSLFPLLGIPLDPGIFMADNDFLFLAYTILVVGLLEEVFKFLPFLLLVRRFKTFDERVDTIVYAAVIGLGFASYENLEYLLYLSGFELFGRAVASPLTHTIFASIWGYMAGIAFLRKKNIVRNSILGLALAAVAHGLFDFFTLSSRLRWLAAFLILIIWIWRIVFIDKLQKKNSCKQ